MSSRKLLRCRHPDCGHTWFARVAAGQPVIPANCPRCHSRTWNRKRKSPADEAWQKGHEDEGADLRGLQD